MRTRVGSAGDRGLETLDMDGWTKNLIFMVGESLSELTSNSATDQNAHGRQVSL